MKKNMVRFVALVLCAVLVLGMIPLIASAAITGSGGSYDFETFDDLKELAQICQDYDRLYYCGDGELVISEDLEIPGYVNLYCENASVRIAEGASFGIYTLSAGTLIVDGELVTYGATSVNTLLEVNGSLMAYGVDVWNLAQVTGLENITISENSAISFYCYPTTMEELKLAVARAEAITDSRVRFTVTPQMQEITESVDFPDNTWLSIGAAIVIPAGVVITVDDVGAGMGIAIYGELRANIVRYAYQSSNGCTLTVADGGLLDAGMFMLTSNGGEKDLSVILRDVDLSKYEIVLEEDLGWDMYNWELVKTSGSVPAAKPGDLSGDGITDDSDVALLLWHTLFPDQYEVRGATDFNADGITDDADVAYLLWHTLFPESYPIN